MKLFSDVKHELFRAGHAESVHSSRVSKPLLLSERLLRRLNIFVFLGVRLLLYNLLCHTTPPLSLLGKKCNCNAQDVNDVILFCTLIFLPGCPEQLGKNTNAENISLLSNSSLNSNTIYQIGSGCSRGG